MGFSEDGDTFALRVGDELMGNSYQVYDAAARKVVKTYLYTAFTDEGVWAKVKRRHHIVPLYSATQRRPGDGLTLLGGDDGPWVVIYAMRGERAVPYLRIPRLSNDDGRPAAIAVRRIAWSPRGDYAVIIHNQRAARPRPFDSDYLHVLSVDPARLPFAPPPAQ